LGVVFLYDHNPLVDHNMSRPLSKGSSRWGKGQRGRRPCWAQRSTDIKLDAEIHSYAWSKGLFAGVSLEGAKVNTDEVDPQVL
jgi:hypothetical protein